MQYMCLIYSTEGVGPQPGTPEFGAFMKGYADFGGIIQKAGKFIADDARCKPVATATTVSVREW